MRARPAQKAASHRAGCTNHTGADRHDLAPIVKVTESAVDAMVTSPAVTEVEKAVPRAAATPLGVRTV